MTALKANPDAMGRPDAIIERRVAPVIVNKWLTVRVGCDFAVPQATKFAARTAAYYRKHHGRRFACRKYDPDRPADRAFALRNGGTIVTRIA